MAFSILTQDEFHEHCQSAKERSFLQSLEMAELLTKRGFDITYVGWKKAEIITISAILYSKSMTGGLHMEINAGPVTTDEEDLPAFYQGLINYAKTNKALQLLVKPYQTYQAFDSNGQPTSPERVELIKQLTQLGFQHDGLQTGYPEGEPVWHYVKDLTGLDEESLNKSYSKKGKALIKKVKTFGITIRPLEKSELPIFKEITSATSERRDYTDKSLEYYEQLQDCFGDEAEFMLASINFSNYHDSLVKEKKEKDLELEKLHDIYKENSNSAKYHRLEKDINIQLTSLQDRLNEANGFIDIYGNKEVPLAASLFIYTSQETAYLFSGSLPEFNKFYAPALLQDYALKESIKRHIPTYNFLGITGNFDGRDGVLRFKQNFNGYITRKMGTFRYYPSPIKYKGIQLLKKILGR